MIAIITNNTAKAAGQLWEIRSAVAIRLPLMPMYATQDNRPRDLPAPLDRMRIEDWTWDNINRFLGRL